MVGANVVRDFQIGNTRVRIADNYCKKTASDVERILQRIAKQAQRQFNAAAATGNYEQEQNTQISHGTGAQRTRTHGRRGFPSASGTVGSRARSRTVICSVTRWICAFSTAGHRAISLT